MAVKYECDACDDPIPEGKTVNTMVVNGKSFYLDEDCYEQIIDESETFKALVFSD